MPPSRLVSAIRPAFVVAIPVKYEQQRLPACLRALAKQRDASGLPIQPTLIRVVIFANNCSDQSAPLARELGRSLSLDIRIVEARLPPEAAHAGAARRAAMDLAEAWLAEGGDKGGAILTTDADSQVAPNWIAANLAAFEAGADAVLGRIDLDDEGKLLPDALLRRGALEDAYESLLTDLLLVDDEAAVRLSTAEMLADLGYAVIEAASAEEALGVIGNGAQVRLVVTDHLMPGMSGTDLAHRLRESHPEVAVLILSGYADVEGVAPNLPD
ncbi:MAG: response regulator [Acidobacteriaceae bacterium]|nr:response regulator [Acidobacteriaceae bacterium]